ncbi:MAG: YigZ family protein [Myxococcota bacterium]
MGRALPRGGRAHRPHPPGRATLRPDRMPPSLSGYTVPAEEAAAEIEVLRSRFLATAAPAPDEAAAQALLARLRAAHPEAHHHCWAYLVGPPGSTRTVGFSDDGEPHNTAGRPMFDIVLHSGVGDLAVVVTRWFGGTKLGRGGLVRAYGDAVQAVLEVLPTTLKVDWKPLDLVIDYAHVEPLERLLPELGAEVLARDFGARARLRIQVPRERATELERRLADLTRGAAAVGSPEEA